MLKSGYLTLLKIVGEYERCTMLGMMRLRFRGIVLVVPTCKLSGRLENAIRMVSRYGA